MNPPSNPSLPSTPHVPGAPWPIDEAAAYLRISTRHLWRLIDARKARAVRLGRRRMLPDAEVQRLAREGC